MNDILSLLLLGLSFGFTYFLLATGLTLTMGLMRVVNMAHGALYMIAGYLGVWVYTQTNNWILSLVAGAALAGGLGYLMETGFLKRLYKSPPSQVLLTIGFINIIMNIAQWIWGGYPKIAPVPESLSGSVSMGSVDIPVFRFFIIGFGLVMAILLWWMQDKTRIGAMVRAGMDNGEIAGTLGMDNKKIFTAVFVAGSLIAGLSAMIGGTITGIHMNTGWDVLLTSIIVVVVGGTGSIPGALLGGLLIGLVNTFGTAYFPNFSSFIIYAVLIVILLIKPSGLLGRKLDVNRAVEDSPGKSAPPKRNRPAFFEKEGAELTGGLRGKVMAYRAGPYMIGLFIFTVIPLFMSDYSQGIMTRVLVFALFAMSLDIIMGYTGMRSFGHAAFFGMGGYTVGLLAVHLNITSFWVVLPITIAACAALSAIIGYFTLKVSGVHFLLVTMAFGQLLSVVAIKWDKVTGGTDGLIGIPRPNLGFPVDWTSGRLYYFVLIVFLICYYLLYRIMHSSYGRALVGVRENEGRMRSLGFNTWLVKYGGMILAGVFAGIAGLLYAYSYRAMVPRNFALETSALPMLMVIMGGGGTLWGPVVGAGAIVLVQNYANIYAPERWPLILGILYVVCVMFLQGGFSRYLTRFWDWVGRRMFSEKDLKL
ncbi:MAG: ABC transporter permease [Clostridiales bacterium]|nr:ABC transporter permease [Clostridiales bacterium]